MEYPKHHDYCTLSLDSYWDLTTGRIEGPWSWQEIHIRLARIHRFSGASIYSVLHHAWAVAHVVKERGGNEKGAFLHDHHEALIGDIPSPLKRLMGYAFHQVDRATQDFFLEAGNTTLDDLTHTVDWEACCAEAYLIGLDPSHWSNSVPVNLSYWQDVMSQSCHLTPTKATAYLESML